MVSDGWEKDMEKTGPQSPEHPDGKHPHTATGLLFYPPP